MTPQTVSALADVLIVILSTAVVLGAVWQLLADRRKRLHSTLFRTWRQISSPAICPACGETVPLVPLRESDPDSIRVCVRCKDYITRDVAEERVL